MNTFTNEELDRITVNYDEQSLNLTQEGAVCYIQIHGLDDFATRAFNITEKAYPNAETTVYATVDARKCAVTQVWLCVEPHKVNVSDRAMTILLSKHEGRYMFNRIMKVSDDRIRKFIRKIADDQIIEENRNNSSLWWSIMTTDEKTGRKNSACLQGTIADCEKRMIAIAHSDRSKYASGLTKCFATPQSEQDLTLGMNGSVEEGGKKIQIKGYSKYIGPFDTEFAVNYTATARV